MSVPPKYSIIGQSPYNVIKIIEKLNIEKTNKSFLQIKRYIYKYIIILWEKEK